MSIPHHKPPKKLEFPQLIDAETMAEPLGVTGRTILNWAASGKIPTALRIGKVVRFDANTVLQALGIDSSPK